MRDRTHAPSRRAVRPAAPAPVGRRRRLGRALRRDRLEELAKKRAKRP